MSVDFVCVQVKTQKTKQKFSLFSLPSSNSYQKNNVGVPKPPDLWIHHDQMELKNIDKTMHGSTPGEYRVDRKTSVKNVDKVFGRRSIRSNMVMEIMVNQLELEKHALTFVYRKHVIRQVYNYQNL